MSRGKRLESPGVARMTSGGASSSSAADGEVAGSFAASATLFLDRRAARWLTLEAAKVDLAAFLGSGRVALGPLWPAAAISAVLTAWGVAMISFLLAGCAATSAKDLASAGEDTAGGEVEAAGAARDSFFASLHFFDLSRFQLRLFSLRRGFFSAGSPMTIWQVKSTQTASRRLYVSSFA